MQRSLYPRILAISIVYAFVSIASLFAPASQAGPAPVIVVLDPCPPGYNHSHQDQFSGWQVCVSNSVPVPTDETPIGDFALGCPMVNSGDFLQAWNPDAGVCFVVENKLDLVWWGGVGLASHEVFSISRNASSNQLLIDLHDNFVAAGCAPGATKPYLLSPNGVYCIKDMNEEYEFSEIESMAENFELAVYECVAEEERIDAIIRDYEWYLDFTYYSNPNIRINWGLSANTYESSRGSQTVNQIYPAVSVPSETLSSGKDQKDGSRMELDYISAKRCRVPVLRTIIGITNQ